MTVTSATLEQEFDCARDAGVEAVRRSIAMGQRSLWILLRDHAGAVCNYLRPHFSKMRLQLTAPHWSEALSGSSNLNHALKAMMILDDRVYALYATDEHYAAMWQEHDALSRSVLFVPVFVRHLLTRATAPMLTLAKAAVDARLELDHDLARDEEDVKLMALLQAELYARGSRE